MKKSNHIFLRMFSVLLIFCVLVCFGTVSALADNSVIQIETKQQLDAVRKNLSGNYVLKNDIVFEPTDFVYGGDFYNNGNGFEPFGTDDHPFSGIFDGNGFGIYGLEMQYVGATTEIETWTGDYKLTRAPLKAAPRLGAGIVTTPIEPLYGLFACSSGTIKDLYLDVKINITNTGTKPLYVGGLVGNNQGTVSNCAVAGSVTASGHAFAGGLCGDNYYGAIEKCYNLSTVTADGYAGGLVGLLSGRAVTDSYNDGTVVATTGGAGGLAGSMKNGKLVRCCTFNTQNISATTPAVCGALAAECGKANLVENCYYLAGSPAAIPNLTVTATAVSAENLAKTSSYTALDFTNTWAQGPKHPLLSSGILGGEKIEFTAPKRVEYFKNTNTLVLADAVVTKSYSNGLETVKTVTAQMVSGFDSSKIGTQSLTVTAFDKTFNFDAVFYGQGDANGDGSVTLKDAALISQHVAGWQNDDIYLSLCDVTEDSSVDLKDTVQIVRNLLTPAE